MRIHHPANPARPVHILIIDDDAPTVRMIQFLLDQEGLQTSSANDGESALQQYLIQVPDLILLNVIMPDTDGFQLHNRFRELGYEGLVMFVTARPDIPIILAELELDVAGCIVKPLHPDEVLDLVQDALGKLCARQLIC